jgi:PIN domain nuclease of toxin-antitoxin system
MSNLIYFSVGSAWEISIKHNLGQIDLPHAPNKYIPANLARYKLILIDAKLEHTIRAGGLPIHHKDPFDRLLIAQAQIEALTIATPDRAFAAYDVERLW